MDNEFKRSPLYAFLKAVGNLFKKKEGAPADLSGDDFSGFLKVDKVICKVMRFFCWLSAVALIVVMLVAFINVIGEKLGRAGVSWAKGIPNSTAIIQYFHIPLVFLAAGYVTLDQGHTRIDLLIHRWPGLEKVFMLIGHVLGAALSFFISYRGTFVTLAENLRIHAHISTTADSWSVWPFTVCHCVGFFLLGVSFVWALARLIRFWKYEGVNPGVYLYPDADHGPGAPGGPGNDALASAIEEMNTEGGADA